ncbi:MAG: ABC transporter permease [Acidobacteriota bacterium]
MLAFLRELPTALRGLRRRPGFSAAVVLTLALGIGTNTGIFTLVHAVLLRPLPFTEPDRLLTIASREPGSDRQPFSILDLDDLRRGTDDFEALAAWAGWSANLTAVDEPTRIQAQWATAGFFRLLGARAALGRTPLPEEEQPGAPRVVLLSDSLWRGRFGADPSILGRVLTLNGQPFSVVGVLPPEFVFFTPGAELVAPLVVEDDARRAKRGAAFLRPIGRLRAHREIAAVTAALDTVVARLRTAFPDTNSAKAGVKLTPLTELVVGDYRRTLLMLQAAVAMVLLIACTNIASLLLTRALRRRAEFAVRSALGAARRDLARQLAVETLVLSIFGGVLGVLAAFAGVKALLAFGPGQLPRANEISVDGTVLAFSAIVSVAVGLALGVLPALQFATAAPAEGLRAGNRSGSRDRRGQRSRAWLIGAEVALSLVLLVGAGLLIRSLQRLRGTDPGFRADHLLTAQLSLPKNRYSSPATITQFGDRLMERVKALPGVTHVAVASVNPLTQWRANVSFTMEGGVAAARKDAPIANYRAVAPGYFATLGTPLLAGRDLSASDRADSLAVAVISSNLAERYFIGSSPLGKRIAIDDTDPWRTLEIVGVVGDVKHAGLDADGTADVYVPYAQTPQDVAIWLANLFCIAVRTEGDPHLLAPALRREVLALDRDVAPSAIRTMDEAVASSLSVRSFDALLLELFGGTALLLALLGIYAVTAFAVAEHHREIGVRMSLGADRGTILRWVIGRSMTPVVAGLLAGGVAALLLGRLIATLLFGVTAHDVTTFMAAAALLGLAGLLASALPALRATQVDPMRALSAD